MDLRLAAHTREQTVVGKDGAEVRARLDRVEVNTSIVGHGATTIRS
jgi:hypothetical protein